MAARQRIYSLDMVKIVAMIAVFTVHFIMELYYANINSGIMVMPNVIFNVYLGGFGVSLFFISSGASLQYVYGEKCELGTYYKKRFLGIYPMFWLAFICAFCFRFILNGTFDMSFPKWKIIYSILGVDGDALFYGPNFYQLGEWFLGTIIALYIVYPLLRRFFNPKPLATVIAAAVIYVLCLLFYKAQLPIDCLFLARIPELLFGMCVIRYKDKIKWPAALAGAAAVAAVALLPGTGGMLRTTIVGIGAFTAMYWLFGKLPASGLVKNLSAWGKDNCYPFFLVHHVIITTLAVRFAGKDLGKTELLILYIACFGLSVIFAKLLAAASGSVVAFFGGTKKTSGGK